MMPDNAALTADHPPRTPQRRSTDWVASHIGMGLLIGLGFFLAVFIFMRLGVTYRLQSDITRIQARLDAHEQEYDQLRKELTVRLSDMEKTLFGEIQPLAQQAAKKPAQPLSRLEAWMTNSNKDLRERIDRIERLVKELRDGR